MSRIRTKRSLERAVRDQISEIRGLPQRLDLLVLALSLIEPLLLEELVQSPLLWVTILLSRSL